jgi:two-component sensor histidine kinase
MRELMPGLRFTASRIALQGGSLVAAGRFGLLCCQLSNDASVLAPQVYHNIRNINYTEVYGLQLSGGKVLLHSDRGLYTIPIPSDSPSQAAAVGDKPGYHMLLSQHNRTRSFSSGDTLLLSQEEPTLSFEVVNPAGNGELKFKYASAAGGGNWQELRSAELNLSGLRVGEYLPLSLIAYDDVWKSKLHTLTVYIAPYWWQTRKWIVLLSIGAVVLVLAAGSIIYALAQRIAMRKAAEQNRLMALELRSVYAQINPHFIFNTLNTSLFLIRSNRNSDAYSHINRFSRLLRTYLKSSRERLISLEEEVRNLRDYIELQQARFVDRFHYDIEVDSRLSPASMLIPSLLLQPLVENAIIHGLLPKEGTGRLSLSFTPASGNYDLLCTIEDDGIGREQARSLARPAEPERQSYGTLLLSELIQLYNKAKESTIDIEYVDKEAPTRGTIVLVYIKVSATT